jgi:hypothetical protein
MPKFLVSLFIVFSLLFAPIAHASGMACSDNGMGGIAKVELKQDFSKDSKQTGDKAEKTGHHCCCSHTACDRIASKIPDMVPAVSKVAIPATDDAIASIAFGPPLEPPSHA